MLPKMAWGSFRYTGPMIIETEGLEGSEYDGSPRIYHTVGECQPISGAPYEVFGGTACELWAKKFPEVPIRNFVDITGDIDVMVSLPTVIPEDADLRKLIDEAGSSAVKPLMFYEGSYTVYGDMFTKWLFEQILHRVEEIAPYFDIKDLILPGYKEDPESALSDLHVAVGNLLVCRLVNEDKSLIKIQILTKVVPDIVHNIMELIVAPNGSFTAHTRFTVDGIHVQGLIELLYGQLNGLTGRASGMMSTMAGLPGIGRMENYPSFYKFDNHCARLIYIATLLKFVEGKRYPENKNSLPYLTEWQAVDILEQLYDGGKGAICNIHFKSDYIDRLLTIFETMRYIGIGRLRASVQARIKQKRNRLK